MLHRRGLTPRQNFKPRFEPTLRHICGPHTVIVMSAEAWWKLYGKSSGSTCAQGAPGQAQSMSRETYLEGNTES